MVAYNISYLYWIQNNLPYHEIACVYKKKYKHKVPSAIRPSQDFHLVPTVLPILAFRNSRHCGLLTQSWLNLPTSQRAVDTSVMTNARVVRIVLYIYRIYYAWSDILQYFSISKHINWNLTIPDFIVYYIHIYVWLTFTKIWFAQAGMASHKLWVYDHDK